jgi:hypothetical protein
MSAHRVEPEHPCPECGGSGLLLGLLGLFCWYRCRACGFTFHVE